MIVPATLLAIALMAALGARLSNVIIALAIVFTPRVARVVRSVTLVARELDYVQAAQALGARDSRILARHILPNCLPPVIVQGTFIFAESVLVEAALSFLGVGLPPDIPSWDTIITTGPDVHADGAVDHDLPRSSDLDCRAWTESPWRRAARSCRPSAAGPVGMVVMYKS